MNQNTGLEIGVVVARRDLVSAELSGELVMLNLNNGVYYSLDPVGTYVWSLLSVPRGLDELCAALTERYAVSEAQCRADLLELLATLQAEGLIDVTGEAHVATS